MFDQIKKQAAQQNRPRTRVIQVEEYIKDQNPANWKMRGKDLFETDDNGVPKEVVVSVRNTNENIQGVADFANPNSLNATNVGGIVRLDRAVEQSNGQVVAPHLQRLAQNEDMIRYDSNMAANKIGVHRGWAKVVPITEGNGEPKVFYSGRNNPMHRANAFVVPEENAENEQAFTLDGANASDNEAILKDQLGQAADKAINEAPEKTQPMVRLRSEGDLTPLEITIPTRLPDAQGNYHEATHDQMKEAFFNNNYVQGLMSSVGQIEQGTTIHAANGFRVGVFGSTIDFQTGQPTTSLVEEMADQTKRRFPRPDAEGNAVLGRKETQYKLGVLSIEIPYLDAEGNPSQRGNATMKSFGGEPRMKASPVAKEGLHSENPWAHEWQQFQAANQAVNQGGPKNQSANTSAQQASYRAQEPDNRAAAAAAATTTAATAASEQTQPAASEQPAPEPEPEPMSADTATQADMMGDLPDDGIDFDDMDALPDADELENQIGPSL